MGARLCGCGVPTALLAQGTQCGPAPWRKLAVDSTCGRVTRQGLSGRRAVPPAALHARHMRAQLQRRHRLCNDDGTRSPPRSAASLWVPAAARVGGDAPAALGHAAIAAADSARRPCRPGVDHTVDGAHLVEWYTGNLTRTGRLGSSAVLVLLVRRGEPKRTDCTERVAPRASNRDDGGHHRKFASEQRTTHKGVKGRGGTDVLQTPSSTGEAQPGVEPTTAFVRVVEPDSHVAATVK